MSDHITDPNMPSDLRALAARVAAGEDPDEIKGAGTNDTKGNHAGIGMTVDKLQRDIENRRLKISEEIIILEKEREHLGFLLPIYEAAKAAYLEADA